MKFKASQKFKVIVLTQDKDGFFAPQTVGIYTTAKAIRGLFGPVHLFNWALQQALLQVENDKQSLGQTLTHYGYFLTIALL